MSKEQLVIFSMYTFKSAQGVDANVY